ncbi:MAG: hypothetical protein Q9199_003043 [Rusavskia elegans]
MIPAFIFSDLGFLVLNAGNGEETTADQDFFINALYGTSHDDDVQVYYGANLRLVELQPLPMAGFDYFRNLFEMEAFQKQEQVNKLLEDEVGTQFMDNWKSNFWATTLGLPTRTEYVLSPNEPSRYFLPFQSGSATLDCNPTGECIGTSKVG